MVTLPQPHPSIDVVLVGDGSIEWSSGDVFLGAKLVTAGDAFNAFARAKASQADAVLFWDPTLGRPDEKAILKLLDGPADVYHAGLLLGLGNLPRVVGLIEPLWMHNCDAPSSIESTSWRLSLRACLVRRAVIQQMRGPNTVFHTATTAALEMGFRWLRRGVFLRHTPVLLTNPLESTVSIHACEEFQFGRCAFGASWAAWAAIRGVMTGHWSVTAVASLAMERQDHASLDVQTFRRETREVRRSGAERVSVLVPTIERYPYLRVLLEQLRAQSIRPHEVIVIDQTPAADRDTSIASEFRDLPLRWLYLDAAGQCSARNAGLVGVTGDFVLFVDDDSELGPDVIEKHLEALARFGADASCGIAHEVGIPELPENFHFTRASDVFPTNNTMAKVSLLDRAGLFDTAFDRQPRADADLGMRAHLSGAFLVLEPSIQILHHHAPRGGLRVHGARVVTYASSRQSIWQRHLPSASELYLAARYFDRGHVREVQWQKAAGTLSGHGGRFQRVIKAVVGAMRLVDTVVQLRRTGGAASAMVLHGPRIPTRRQAAK